MTGSARFPVRIQSKTPLADDIIGLTLVSLDRSPLPSFEAGAHIDLQLPNGLIRQYSLCNNPAETGHYQLGILLTPDSRGGSLGVHHTLATGDDVLISKPRNLFPLIEAQHTVLIAGGIGVTPLLAMADTLSSRGSRFEFHYCVRSHRRAAFLEDMETSTWSEHLHTHIDEDPDSHPLNLNDVLNTHHHKQLFICGPEGFIQSVSNAARAQGWPESQIHFEQFSAPQAETPSASGQTDFELMIASTGQIIPVPDNQSAAQAMSSAGLSVSLSCEQGICGSCLTPIVDGIPDHHDHFQTEPEKATNRHFTPCCSRAKTRRLVLDL